MRNLAIVLFFISLTAFSQTAIKKSSIDSGGASVTNGNTTIIYTVGEVVIQEETVGNIHLSEGFIGKDIQKALGVSNFELFNEFKIYPNPTSDYVNIIFNKSSNYEISITDLNGKRINHFKSKKLSNTINISKLSAGIYLIVLKDTKAKKYNSIKLIKK